MEGGSEAEDGREDGGDARPRWRAHAAGSGGSQSDEDGAVGGAEPDAEAESEALFAFFRSFNVGATDEKAGRRAGGDGESAGPR